MKRFLCILFALCLLSGAASALAGGFCCPVGCPICRLGASCATCPRCASVWKMAQPRETPKPAVSCAASARNRTPAYAAQPTQKPASSTAAAGPTAAPTARPSAGTGDYTTLSIAVQEQKLWNLVNQDRANHGLPELPLDEELSRLARLKSCDMRDNHYFAHQSPTYGRAADMLSAFGYAYNGVGENIAHHATVEKAEAAFLSSTGHRSNLMGSQWKKIGIGVCYDSDGFVYVTQLFVR